MLLVLIFAPAIHCPHSKVLKYPLHREVTDTDVSLQEEFPIPDDKSHKYIKPNGTAQTVKHMFQEHI